MHARKFDQPAILVGTYRLDGEHPVDAVDAGNQARPNGQSIGIVGQHAHQDSTTDPVGPVDAPDLKQA
jgi:hypothetical protein